MKTARAPISFLLSFLMQIDEAIGERALQGGGRMDCLKKGLGTIKTKQTNNSRGRNDNKAGERFVSRRFQAGAEARSKITLGAILPVHKEAAWWPKEAWQQGTWFQAQLVMDTSYDSEPATLLWIPTLQNQGD